MKFLSQSLTVNSTDVCTDGAGNQTSAGLVIISKANFESVFGANSWDFYSCRFTNTNGTVDISFNLGGLPNDEISVPNLPEGFYVLEFRKIGTNCYYSKTFNIFAGCCAADPCASMIENSYCLNVVNDCGDVVGNCTCPEEFPCNPATGRCEPLSEYEISCVCASSDCRSICVGEFGGTEDDFAFVTCSGGSTGSCVCDCSAAANF